jgi:hypothetical protein
MNADALAIIQIGILPGAGLFEVLIVSQQAIARRDVEGVSIKGDAAQTPPAFLPEPLDVGEVVIDFFKDGLVREVN